MKEELLYKYFRVETSPQEEKEILRWLDEDPVNNKEHFDRAHFLFVKGLMFQNSGQGREVPIVRPVNRTRKLLRYAGAAAAAIALVLITANLAQKGTRESISNRLAAVSVPPGQRIQLTLEDGTKVWLNAGTRLEYPVAFSGKFRRVSVSGEAMFEVEYDARRPFIVETFASEIEVLGTTFNVIADRSRNLFSATLVEGSIKVTSMSDDQTVIMEPDDIVQLMDGRLCISRMSDPTALLWTDGLISLKDISFADLMAKFERAFDVKILIDRESVPVTDITSGKIRISDGIDHAMRVLQRGSDFRYEKNAENNVITIY